MSKHHETNNFLCIDCGVDTKEIGEYYMVKDEVWRAAVSKTEKGMLCIDCLEKRLTKKFKRKIVLNFSAFIHCPLNCMPLIYRSHTLVQRMTIFNQ